MASVISGCSQSEIEMPFSDFQVEEEDTSVTFSKANALTTGFAVDLTTFAEDHTNDYILENAGAGLLVDINNKQVLFAQNAFEQKYPASITKVMTCMLALKYCSLDEIITVTEEAASISDPTAVRLGIKAGDTMTMDQALHLCLISSYNDVAIAIGCHISGTEAEFANLMNKEALALGATDTHFTDASGLGSPEHYTTVYDLYLIFNEAIKYPEFLEIVQCKEYQTTYHDKNGKDVQGSSITTNRFFRGTYELPDNVTIVGGKTGTTEDAGYCLILLVKDTYSNPYIAVILGANSKDNLYYQMSDLFLQISN